MAEDFPPIDAGAYAGLESLTEKFERDGVDTRFLQQEFLEASEIGDADSLRERLKHLSADEKRTLVQAVDQHGCTGLLLATRRGDSEVVQLLLGAGANPNDADGSGVTAAHRASGRGSASIIQLLLEARADLRKDDRGDTPLMWATGAEVVEMLLRAGSAADAKGAGGKNALMYASAKGDESAARALARAQGLDLNAKDEQGCTAHALAREAGYQTLMELLLGLGAEASPEPPPRVISRGEAILEAARRGDAKALESLLQSPSPEGPVNLESQVAGETALLLATSSEGSDAGRAVDVLLRARADPCLADAFLGETPLHRAVLTGKSLEVVMLLLEAQADPTREDLAGRRPADVADAWGREEAAELLRAVAEGALAEAP